ncbi:MAG: S41 family peptidase [Bacillota bacterium]|nr:S41 family peptidase [Bacillota bacterium]MDI7249375.1 S41 family peptidase [Bacillota bacterium]
MTFSGECLADADFIIDRVLEVHPRPDFRLGSKLTAATSAFREEARQCQRVADFWYAAQRFMAKIGDAHTLMGPLSTDVFTAPVELELVSGQAVIRSVMPPFEDMLSRGDVVLFVDSQEVGFRLDAIRETTAFNYFDRGSREAVKRLLEFPAGDRVQVVLTVARVSGEVQRIEVPLLRSDSAEMTAWRADMARREVRRIIQWSVLRDGMGYFRYALCHDRTSPRLVAEAREIGVGPDELPALGDSARAFFDVVRAQGLSTVVIDLRGNPGGNSEIARPLLNYICRKPIRSYGVVVKVSRAVQDYLSARWQSLYPVSFKPFVEQYLESAAGQFIEVPHRVLEFPYDGSQCDDVWQFPGRLVVLTDAGTFSSGEFFAAELRDNGVGVFVGEPTGGGGTVPGDQIDFETPYLKLKFSVSYKLFTRPDRQAECLPAVVPDYFVSQALQDYRRGEDTVLNWVIQHQRDLLRRWAFAGSRRGRPMLRAGEFG